MKAFLAAAAIAALLLSGCSTRPGVEAPPLATVYDSPPERSSPTFLTQEEHPAACEIYAVLNVLPALGVEASYDDVLKAMPGFQGDPDTVGWAWPEDVCAAINTFSPGSARVDTGSSYDSLLEDGYAIIWITTDYSLPDGPVDNVWPDEHCVLMISDDGHGASVSDSLFGFTLVPTDILREVWEACGSRCVKINRQ